MRYSHEVISRESSGHDGELKAELERRAEPLAEPDLRMAAIAVNRGLTLVTRNTKHFRRVPGLTVENWVDDG